MNNIEKKILELKRNTDNKLEERVLRDLLKEDEPETYLKDLLNHGCQCGMVRNLIYFADTKKFYIKYLEEIDEIKENLEFSTGEVLKVKYPSYNFLAWFGYEETARNIADKLELDY